MLLKPILNTDIEMDQTNYQWFDNVLNEEKLEWINNLSEIYPIEPGVIVGNDDDKKIRNSSIRWIHYDNLSAWVYDDLSNIAIEANNKWKFDLNSIVDSIQYSEYSEDGGHYDWHLDIGPTINHRKVSVISQLSGSDEYEGGELQIWTGGEYKTVPKDKGSCIVFPSFIMHRVTPVTKGTRKSLVLWVGGGSYK